MTNDEGSTPPIRHSAFVILSSFVIRPSALSSGAGAAADWVPKMPAFLKRLLIKLGIAAGVIALAIYGIMSLFRGGGGLGLFGGGGNGPGTGPGTGTGPADGPPTKVEDPAKRPPDPAKKPDEKTLPRLPGVQETPDGIVMNIRIVDQTFEFDGQPISAREFVKEIERVRYKHPNKTVRVTPHPTPTAKERTIAELNEALRGVNVLYTPP
jgi:hypothetical protein